ncbi:MAG: type II toxin-antitoxin system Phd/YefM family antitoxin [Chloroflexi bacterium]|nr:type II toxin-antitoxin system Phd/YefM family antitoxin [Chloroflexota bacterium]
MSHVGIAEASRSLSQLVDRAARDREIIILTLDGQAKAVLVGIEAFEELFGTKAQAEQPTMPLDEFQREFHEALVEAGYDSREKVIELVREVRREIAVERTGDPTKAA